MNLTYEGRPAKVDGKGRLKVAATATTDEHAAAEDGDAYLLNGTVTDDTVTSTATGGVMLYLKNTSATRWLEVYLVEASAAVAGGVLKLVMNPTEGTLGAETVAVPANLNAESGRVADAEAYAWDESGDGMTGLSAGTILKTKILAVGDTSESFNGALMLGQNDSLSVAFSGAAGEFEASIRFHFVDKD